MINFLKINKNFVFVILKHLYLQSVIRDCESGTFCIYYIHRYFKFETS